MSLRLRSGLSFCRIGDRLVFLDVTADRYFCLNDPLEAAVQRLSEDAATRMDSAIDALLKRGLLVAHDGQAIAPCVTPPEASESLLDRRTVVGTGATIRALMALWSSMGRVKFQPLKANLAAIRARRRDLKRGSFSAPLALIAGAFDRASDWASLHDRCLPQSLAVARAALGAGHDVQVVLGVSLGPFFAHCWVQKGCVVVNDRVDQVRRFTPILVV